MSGKSKLARFWTLIRAIRLKHRALFGASIGWMLSDFLYYGPMFNAEHLSLSIQGNEDSLHAAIAQLILNIVVIAPSYIFSVYWFSSWIQRDRKNVQFIAFMLLCIFYIIQWFFDQGINKACVRYDVLKHTHQRKGSSIEAKNCSDHFNGRTVLVSEDSLFVDCRCKEYDVYYISIIIILIARAILFLGTVNLTTFIIGADSGPRIAPGTFYGFCACGGKVGAILSIFVYNAFPKTNFDSTTWSLETAPSSNVILVLAFVSATGAVSTALCVPPRKRRFNQNHGQFADSVRLSDVDVLSKLSSTDFSIPAKEIKVGIAIGKGGSGVVYRGKFADQKICLKLLVSSIMTDNDVTSVKEFEHECSIMLRISHPNIVRFFGYTIMPTIKTLTGSSLYMVSELCTGGAMYDVVTTNLATEKQLHRWFIQICNAMSYLHNRASPIVHLDIKPQNILLDNTNLDTANIKICDLGASKVLGKDLYFRAEQVGTPGFMPPELLQSALNQVDHIDGTKVDIYEAGISFGYMWTGIAPFEEFFSMNKAGFMSLKDSLYERIIQGMRPRFENGHRMIPKELATLIDAMVSQIPSDRPSFEDCKNALQAFAQAR